MKIVDVGVKFAIVNEAEAFRTHVVQYTVLANLGSHVWHLKARECFVTEIYFDVLQKCTPLTTSSRNPDESHA
eukprot:4619351-Pleurochrysis_carterae.AAC.1